MPKSVKEVTISKKKGNDGDNGDDRFQRVQPEMEQVHPSRDVPKSEIEIKNFVKKQLQRIHNHIDAIEVELEELKRDLKPKLTWEMSGTHSFTPPQNEIVGDEELKDPESRALTFQPRAVNSPLSEVTNNEMSEMLLDDTRLLLGDSRSCKSAPATISGSPQI